MSEMLKFMPKDRLFLVFFQGGRADKAWLSHLYNDLKNHLYAVCPSQCGVEIVST